MFNKRWKRINKKVFNIVLVVVKQKEDKKTISENENRNIYLSTFKLEL